MSASTPAHDAVTAIPDAELPALFGYLAMGLVDEKRLPELRAVIAAIDPAIVLATRERREHRRIERQAETAAQEAREKARIEEERARIEENKQHRLLWADWLETHREELDALRNEAAPVELSMGATCWVACLHTEKGVYPHGTGTTIDEAHRAYVTARLEMIATPEDAANAWGEPPAEISELALLPSCYVRISGPEDAVRTLARVL